MMFRGEADTAAAHEATTNGISAIIAHAVADIANKINE
jgi:hypothetical protein